MVGYANSVAGWKRSLTNDSPLFVFNEGRPILSVGAPGGRKIINRVTQIVLNVLGFGMGIQEAITKPTVDVSSRSTLVDSRIPQTIVAQLECRGHPIQVVDEEIGNLGHFARPSGILLDYDSVLIHGGADVFRPVTAFGY
jgi:gamma-glutamyltranspeptidase/glutathione hydrolase